MENSDKKVWARTIAPELLAAWQELKRKKDAEIIAKELKISRPVIDRALHFGYVSIPELVDKINNYFSERLKRERQQAASLLSEKDKK